MRLKASNEDVFKLMDLRECCIILAIACGIGFSFSCWLVAGNLVCWDFWYLASASFLGLLLFLARAIKTGQRIMEADSCFLSLEKESLAVCQPGKNGHYERCRIFYREMEKIVEGSRRGTPEVFVVMKEKEDRQSFILLDDEEQHRLIFCVRSYGYDREAFQKFYKKLCWTVPGKVHIFGTKNQEVWQMHRARPEAFILAALLALYLVPKALELFF